MMKKAMKSISSQIKINCVIDARVSSDKQLDGYSLDDQEIVCGRFADARNWNILETFSKSYSGRKEMREDFQEILSYIQKFQINGQKVDYYLIKSIDRFTRLGSGVYDEMKQRLSVIGVQLIDAYGVIQPEINKLEHLGVEYDWSKQSATHMAQIMEAERARQETVDILVRMIGAEIALTQAGYKARGASDGFANKDIISKTGQKVKIQVRDPERALYYEKMYELRARGDMSDEQIVKEVNAMGFLSKEKTRWEKIGKQKRAIGVVPGKPLTVKQLQKVIKKPAYVGIVCEKWTQNKPIWSQSEKLVDIEMFNNANRGKVFIKIKEDGNPSILYDYSDSKRSIQRRNKYSKLFLYDKMIACPECSKPFLRSSSKGKSGDYFPAYHCARDHARVSANKFDFENNVTKFIENIKFRKGFADALEFMLIKKFRERQSEVLSTASRIGENVSTLQSKQASLVQSIARLNSLVAIRKIEDEIETLEKRIKSAATQRDKLEIQERDIKTFIDNAKDLMEHPGKMLVNNTNPHIQKQLFGLVFDGVPTYYEILNGTPKLTLVFKASEEFKRNKSLEVTLRGIKWNTLENMVKTWNEVFVHIKEYQERQQKSIIS